MPLILLVEDDAVARRLLYHALKERYDVVEAGDRTEAARLLDDFPIDLVILDLHLTPDPATPDEGLRLLRRIRVRREALPVVVTTASEAPGLPERLDACRVDALLRKPVEPATVEAEVSRLLGTRPSVG